MQARAPGAMSKGLLTVWAVVSALIGAYILGGHLTTLPAPDAGDPVLAQGLRALFPPDTFGADAPAPLTAIHVLYERCGCSGRVAEALRARGPRPSLREAVVMLSDDPAPSGTSLPPPSGTLVTALGAAGFPVVTLRSAEVEERLHVQAVPFLVVLDAGDRVRYAGGYTATRERPDLQDDRLITEVRAGRSPAALPVFGCATASALRQKLDPLGLKY
jgi:hypothetical protein